MIPPANVDIDRSRRDAQKHRLDSRWNIMAGITDTSMSEQSAHRDSQPCSKAASSTVLPAFLLQNRSLHAAKAPVSLVDAPVIVNTLLSVTQQINSVFKSFESPSGSSKRIRFFESLSPSPKSIEIQSFFTHVQKSMCAHTLYHSTVKVFAENATYVIHMQCKRFV